MSARYQENASVNTWDRPLLVSQAQMLTEGLLIFQIFPLTNSIVLMFLPL